MVVRVEDLSPKARELLEESVGWMDRFWDPAAGLLWNMGDAPDPASAEHEEGHPVRETAWYALGLLLRDGPGDTERAVQGLEAVLANQFDEPGKVYHGTFYRAPEEPHPPENPVEWHDYDPNWREFIITTISIILDEYADRLPQALIARIDVAIRKAVEGTLTRPLRAGYTNIALMNAQMLVWAGRRLGETAWVERGVAMGREVYRLFKLHDAFEEYNSPTYYGPDIYALRLWESYCPSPVLPPLASEMQALLWRDIARFYHAGLRNIAGPYDRSYGMDMRRYVAILGEWMWLVTGRERAPFPARGYRFAHAGDFCFGPLVALLGARVPADAVPDVQAFCGERTAEHVIADGPRRVATAWLGQRAMIGAESTERGKKGYSQFHSATIHWEVDRDHVGWLRLVHTVPVDAIAGRRRLEIAGAGPMSFQIDAPDLDAAAIGPERWHLPGLDVQVVANMPCSVERVDGQVLVHFAAEEGQETRIVLKLAEG